MTPHQTQRLVDEIARDLDLLSFRLEQPPPSERSPEDERRDLRRALDRLTARLRDIAERLA
jgi:hypothetical protein